MFFKIPEDKRRNNGIDIKRDSTKHQWKKTGVQNLCWKSFGNCIDIRHTTSTYNCNNKVAYDARFLIVHERSYICFRIILKTHSYCNKRNHATSVIVACLYFVLNKYAPLSNISLSANLLVDLSLTF